MRTKLIACFAGACVISTLYVTYRLYDLSSILPQLSIKTAALDDRITKSEALNQRNSDEIASIGKFVRAQNKAMEYDAFPKFEGENSSEVFKSSRKPKSAKSKKNHTTPDQDFVQEQQPVAAARNAVMSGTARNENIVKTVSDDAGNDAKASFHTELNSRISQLKQYASDNSLEKDFAFIADMGINSGKKRFYLVDLNKMAVVKSGLMAYTKKADNSSSAKVYRIEKTGMDFYELYSLDKGGNVISPEPEILSPVNCVSNAESDGSSCESDGGPGISPKFFGEIQQLIKSRKKPMILWMFR